MLEIMVWKFYLNELVSEYQETRGFNGMAESYFFKFQLLK